MYLTTGNECPGESILICSYSLHCFVQNFSKIFWWTSGKLYWKWKKNEKRSTYRKSEEIQTNTQHIKHTRCKVFNDVTHLLRESRQHKVCPYTNIQYIEVKYIFIGKRWKRVIKSLSLSLPIFKYALSRSPDISRLIDSSIDRPAICGYTMTHEVYSCGKQQEIYSTFDI